jgi:hypothetical protein
MLVRLGFGSIIVTADGAIPSSKREVSLYYAKKAFNVCANILRDVMTY